MLGVRITVRDVEMSGPSVAAIRMACTEVTSGGEGTGTTTTRAQLTPAGRRRISQAVKQRHAKQRQQQTTTQPSTTTTNNTETAATARRKQPATAKAVAAGA